MESCLPGSGTLWRLVSDKQKIEEEPDVVNT